MATNLKRILLVSTALVGVAMMSAPASAAVKLDLGGYFRGYGVYADNNEPAGTATNLRQFEFRRDSDIFFTGETTLDNGLTVGAHTDLKIGNGALGANATGTGSVNVEQEYAYASGGWGRFNFGASDGAAYLLQVAAPSADSNIDGMRVRIQGLNPTTSQQNAAFANTSAFNDAVLEYSQDDFRYTDRLTYLTPKFSGFQGGVSYAPSSGFTSNTGAMGVANTPAAAAFVAGGGVVAAYRDLAELSARWDGEFQGLGIDVGGAWGTSSLSQGPTTAQTLLLTAGSWDANDGVDTWNAGLNFTYQGFSLGGGYKNSNTRRIGQTAAGFVAANIGTGDVNRDTWVAGLGYDNGPYHVGGSYLDQKTKIDTIATAGGNIAGTTFESDRYTVGGGYTFGPGMTFRGAVAWGTFDAPAALGAAADNDFTQVTVGTDIQF